MNDLMQRLRDADPAEGFAPYDDLTVQRNLSGITGARTRPSSRPWWIAAAAAIAVGGLGIAQVLTPTPTTAAAEVLKATASAVPADPTAAPDQYWKVTTTGIMDHGWVPEVGPTTLWAANYERVVYVSVSGQQPNWETMTWGEADLVSGPERPFPTNVDSATTSNLTDSDLPLLMKYPTPAFLDTLPREPAPLLDTLRAEGAQQWDEWGDPEQDVYATPDALAFGLAHQILLSGRAPADLTAALLEALALLPDLVVQQDATVMGKTGVGIRYQPAEVPADVTHELVLDPGSGEILGERMIMLSAHGRWSAGEVGSEQRYDRELVDAVPTEVQAKATRMTCRVVEDTLEMTCTG